MKKKVMSVFLTFLLIFVNFSIVMADEDIKDISSDHWAYESVVELVDEGYMSLQEGNEFKGEKEVTRYELAEVIAKVLKNINQGNVDPESDDVLTLKKLSTEFRSELVEVVNQNEDLEEKLNDLSDQQEINKEDVVDTNSKIKDMRKEVDEILESITEEAIRTNKLQKKLNKLETKNKDLKKQVDEVSSEMENKTTDEKVEKLEQRFFWLTGGWIVSALLLASQ